MFVSFLFLIHVRFDYVLFFGVNGGGGGDDGILFASSPLESYLLLFVSIVITVIFRSPSPPLPFPLSPLLYDFFKE